MKTRLEVHLFGRMELRLGGRLLPDFPTRKARHLFARLLLHPDRRLTREALMECFWAGRAAASASRSLRTDLWRIRKIIEPEGTARGTFLASRKQNVSIAADADYWLDVDEFERLFDHANSLSQPYPTAEAAREFEEAVSLFRGDLLDGCDEPWCEDRHERLSAMLVASIESLMNFHARSKSFEKAIMYGLELLRLDPLREHVHRCVMLCHHLMGDRPAAMRQYETCCEVLSYELGIAPIAQTRTLYNQIKSGALRNGERADDDVDALLPWPSSTDPL